MCADSMHAYWVTFWAITSFLVSALTGVLLSLNRSDDWSLADALSEKSTERTVVVNAAGQRVGTDEKPVLVGSTSRLIATIGVLVLTAMMLGVGYAMIWSLFMRGQIPALEGIGPYLMGGAALFAPYAFNQLKDAFKPAPKAGG